MGSGSDKKDDNSKTELFMSSHLMMIMTYTIFSAILIVETFVMNWEKCVNCLLCAPFCPDSCIPVVDGKRQDFDYEHCKGCGICASVCSFKAIAMKEGL